MLNSEFSGNVMVFVNEHNGKKSYSIGISKKLQDGSYENGFLPAQFKKDVVINNKTKIDIKKAWLSFYKTTEGNRTVPFIFINDFTVTEEWGLQALENLTAVPPEEQPAKLPF